ncbi:27 kDa glycoprotein, partial [Eufriesea mexicana]
KCVSNFTTAIEACLEPEERENKKIIQNITDSLLNFVCYKEGDRIALFISANGPECLQSKQQEMQHCIDNTFQGYMSQLDFKNESLPELDSLPSLVFGTKECMDISNIQSCVVRELEKCSDPTPANIVDSILNFIRKVTPCQNLMTL